MALPHIFPSIQSRCDRLSVPVQHGNTITMSFTEAAVEVAKPMQSLHSHCTELTHTGEKPFQCEQFGFTSNQASNLRVRMRTHNGEKPFKCEHCDYVCLVCSFGVRRSMHSAAEASNTKKRARAADADVSSDDE